VVRISDTWLRRRTTVGGWVARHWSGRVLHSRERGRESEIGFLFVFVCMFWNCRGGSFLCGQVLSTQFSKV
jgi:hypothetical protein